MRNRKLVDKLIGLDSPDAERTLIRAAGGPEDLELPHAAPAEEQAIIVPPAQAPVNPTLNRAIQAYEALDFAQVVTLGRAALRERLTAGLSTFAGVLTVVLACIGIYGLLAYAVTARVREIGVRLALGATRATVVRMIVRDGLAVAVPGIVIGVPCALAAARLVRSQLYGIAPNDLPTIIGAAAIFVLTSLIASLLPALRASKIDPMVALRED